MSKIHKMNVAKIFLKEDESITNASTMEFNIHEKCESDNMRNSVASYSPISATHAQRNPLRSNSPYSKSILNNSYSCSIQNNIIPLK